MRGKYPSHFDELWEAASELFAALPLCARTHQSLVVHGGLPDEELRLVSARPRTWCTPTPCTFPSAHC